MKGLLKDQKQTNLFAPNLLPIINPNKELEILQERWNVDRRLGSKSALPIFQRDGCVSV